METAEKTRKYVDYEVSIAKSETQQTAGESFGKLIVYLVMGILFGIILVKSEVVSWFRIQEMFRLQSFHMYGVIGSAIAVGMLSIFLIRKFNIPTIDGEKVDLTPKKFHKGTIYGGLTFGFGWAITGACPGPLYALVGSGLTIMIVPLLSAIVGTYLYALLEKRLPH
jgi:uncharacterized membrane protein YedE/YeeE